MLTQIAQLTPGSVAKVKVLRKGREAELNVTVGERPPPRGTAR
jgi:serine protease DegQ